VAGTIRGIFATDGQTHEIMTVYRRISTTLRQPDFPAKSCHPWIVSHKRKFRSLQVSSDTKNGLGAISASMFSASSGASVCYTAVTIALWCSSKESNRLAKEANETSTKALASVQRAFVFLKYFRRELEFARTKVTTLGSFLPKFRTPGKLPRGTRFITSTG
jgi:hypothetical protein